MDGIKMVDDWLDNLHERGRSELTLEAYRRALDHFIAWNREVYGESFDPGRIIPRDVEDWMTRQRLVDKAAPATVNQRLVALSGFYRWAQGRGLVRRNPTAEVNSVRLGQREPKGLDDRDLRKLLRAVYASENLRDTAMIELLAGTGLRVGELLALKVGDLTISTRSGKVVVRMGKHGGYREVPLTVEVRKALEVYLKKHPNSNNPDALLWVSNRGALTTRSAVLRMLEKYAHAAEIEPMGPHKFRHYFATNYLKGNPGDLRGLAALLGHASLNTVMIYTEPTLDDLANRMQRAQNGAA